MGSRPMLSLEEIAEGLRTAAEPSADDVSVALDGQRLDSPAKVRAWLAEVNAARAAEQDAADA